LEKLRRRNGFGGSSFDVTIILKFILKNLAVGMWFGFNWLQKGPSDGPLLTW
jgi:hypothetical protein